MLCSGFAHSLAQAHSARVIWHKFTLDNLYNLLHSGKYLKSVGRVIEYLEYNFTYLKNWIKYY